VLGDASIHSFIEMAKGALVMVLVMIGFYLLGGMGLMFARWRGIPGRPISDKALSRDTGMVLAVTLMIITCVVVLIGSSWPMISKIGLFKHMPFMPMDVNRPGALLPIFYNTVGSALIIPTLLIMGAIPFLAWGKTNPDKFLWKVLAPWFFAIGAGVVVLVFIWGQQSDFAQRQQLSQDAIPAIGTPAMLVVGIATLGAFAAFANIALAWKVLRSKAVTMGGWLARVGIGILFLGTVLTNVYETTVYGALVEGDPPLKTPFGYSLQFVGWTHDGLSEEAARKQWWEFGHGVLIAVRPIHGDSAVAHADDATSATPKSREELIDQVTREGGFIARAPVFYNIQLAMTGDPGKSKTMRWPYIEREFHRDFYVLVPTDPTLERARVTVRPGDTLPLEHTKYQVHYKKFFMEGAGGQAGTTMGGEMELITPDAKRFPFRSGFQISNEGPKGTVAQIPEVNGAVIAQGGLDPATKEITMGFELPESPAKWSIPIAVTNKPWINLVWLGVITMGLGTLIAMVRRSLEGRKGALITTAVAAGAVDIPIDALPAKNGGGNGSGAKGSGARIKPSRKVKTGR
jgi:cytochrome c-type biogenesis protein CcmF